MENVLFQIAQTLSNVKRKGESGFTARCPCHPDKKNSLSIDYKSGKVLIKCFAHCDPREIIEYFKMRDVWPQAIRAPEINQHEMRTIAREHIYQNDRGTPIYRKLKFTDGTYAFRSGAGSRRGVDPVPYRLPEVLAATDEIHICEGEKDADTLAELGYVATTNDSGGGTWPRGWGAQYFTDKHIVIHEDNDETGAKRTRNIRTDLFNVARSIVVLTYTDCGEHGDVSDWVAKGNGPSEINERIEQLRVPDIGVADLDSPDAWRMQLQSSEKGLRATLYNLQLLLENAWPPKVEYDTFADRTYIDGEPLLDSDIHEAAVYVSQHHSLEYSHAKVYETIKSIAQRNKFDACSRFLLGLQWDGVPRVATWMADYIGSDDGISVNYANEVGYRWLLGSAARALWPGCKQDTMLVLQGAQGTYKSSAVEVLYYDDKGWFLSTQERVGTPNFFQYIQGKLGVEITEMDSMRKAETTAVKAMLTTRVDEYRKPYSKEKIVRPRRTVFIGTNNPGDGKHWFDDLTGARRFFTINVGEIAINELRRDRDQLWAEAVHLVQNKERWHVTDKAVLHHRDNDLTMAAADVDEREAIVDAIKNWGSQPVTVDQVLARLQGDSYVAGRASPRLVQDIRKVLKSLGYATKVRWVDGVSVRRWCKVDT